MLVLLGASLLQTGNAGASAGTLGSVTDTAQAMDSADPSVSWMPGCPPICLPLPTPSPAPTVIHLSCPPICFPLPTATPAPTLIPISCPPICFPLPTATPAPTLVPISCPPICFPLPTATPAPTLVPISCPPICFPLPTATPPPAATPIPAPTLTSINPSSGVPGTFVTLGGANLAGALGVNFGGMPGVLLGCMPDGSSCSVAAPAGALGTGVNVTVTTPGGTSNGLGFTFIGASAGSGGSAGGSSGTGGGSAGTGGGSTGTGGTSAGTGGSSTGTGGASTGAGSSATAGGVPVSFASGWNIVAGPTGSMVTGNSGPLYTYQAGDTVYETLASGGPLTQPDGYWAYFGGAAGGTIPTSGPQTLTVNLPALQWVMIGNPGNTAAAVAGADIVYTYAASGGYQATTSLAPGQGGWAISTSGGTATISNS